VPFGGPSLRVALSTPTGSGIDTDTSTFGLQDLYVQPVWLRWKWENIDLAGSVGFYAPSGRFEAGAADNGRRQSAQTLASATQTSRSVRRSGGQDTGNVNNPPPPPRTACSLKRHH
jgi:Putative MetA-pathway of phenol degradation